MRTLKALVCGLVWISPALMAAQAPSRLVLQITVDQLRGDLIHRYYDRLGPGGFRYLLEKGTVFRNAHHAHAHTETVVGHATLATGAPPSVHGMIGNWTLDRGQNQITYCIEDDRFPLLVPAAAQDPQAAKGEGRSPARLLASTFSDELAASSNGGAKIFAVSIKDRGAVPMAGHSGKAFWFSLERAEFVTSSYYYADYPAWVAAWNALRRPFEFADTSWVLLQDAGTYLFGGADDQDWETDRAGFGRTFPHAYGPAASKNFTDHLIYSPAGDELTADFAMALIESENLGEDTIPDYLSISFSSTDYIGHAFGPSSLESEDGILRLDGTLARLFRFIDERVGLQWVLTVLSADHGSPEAPGYLWQFGQDTGYINLSDWDWTPALTALKSRFGDDAQRLIQNYQHPYIYLDQQLMTQKGLEPAVVEEVLAEELARLPHVWAVFSSSALLEGRVADTKLGRLVLNNLNPGRSGDIYLVFAPNWFINHFGDVTLAVVHGSPWTYDTFVPLVFAGPGVPAGQVYRPVQTTDVAPTLSAFLRIKMPSGATGQPLREVLVATP